MYVSDPSRNRAGVGVRMFNMTDHGDLQLCYACLTPISRNSGTPPIMSAAAVQPTLQYWTEGAICFIRNTQLKTLCHLSGHNFLQKYRHLELENGRTLNIGRSFVPHEMNTLEIVVASTNMCCVLESARNFTYLDQRTYRLLLSFSLNMY